MARKPVAPRITVTPASVDVGDDVLVQWAGDKARRVRIEWSSGNQFITASGPGSAHIAALAAGSVPVVLMSGRYELARTVLTVAGVVVVEPPPVDPPPPPPPPDPVPAVISTFPANGAVDIAVDANVTATFDQDMDPATITNASVLVRPTGGATLPAAVSYNTGTRVVTIDPSSNLIDDAPYTGKVSDTVASLLGVPITANYLWDFQTAAVVTPGGLVPTGYAMNAGVTGGNNATAGNTFTVSTYADFAAKVGLAATRIIKIAPGAGDLNGQGATLSINNGNVTIDGTGWGGSLIRCNIKVSASNVIITQMRIRPGDNVSNVASGACIMINGGGGTIIDRILIDHNSLQWATDACANNWNRPEDVTWQYNIIGPGICDSAAIEASANQGPHAYGFSYHSDPDPNYARRHSIYRNFMLHNRQRSLRGHRAAGVDFVNNVVYDYGTTAPALGNFRGANYLANMYEKGPNSTNNKGFESDLAAGDTYYLDSIYYASSGQTSANLALNYAATDTFAANVRRTPVGNYYPDGSTPPVGLTVTAASQALADAVVAAAGPSTTDAHGYDAQWRTEYAAGTGNFWDGPGSDQVPPRPITPW